MNVLYWKQCVDQKDGTSPFHGVKDRTTPFHKCMYNTRFNGGSVRTGDSSESQSTSNTTTPVIHILDTSRPDKYRKRKKESKEVSDK